jgi:hypothetical protein
VIAGPGSVVLATVNHLSPGVLDIFVSGSAAPLEPTDVHPLYSIDRQGWVLAGDLRVGERLQTETGDTTILEILADPDVHRVYNFEVETDHEYLISALSIRAHNQSIIGRRFTSPDAGVGETANLIESLSPNRVRGVNIPFRRPDGSRAAEADIIVEPTAGIVLPTIVQVKIATNLRGKGPQGLIAQVRKTEARTGIPTVGFSPQLTRAQQTEAVRQGIFMTSEIEALLEILGVP